jgi:hypothetical protein
MGVITKFKKSTLSLLFAVSTLGLFAQTITNKASTTASNQVLPVELTSFNLTSDRNNEIIVSWQTASEVNNSHFKINVSTDGNQFVQYATVNGKGNSNQITDYKIVIDLKSKVIYSALFLSVVLLSSIRNKKLQLAILALLIISVLSCGKEELTEEKNFYVQLSQVDNDGRTTVFGIKVLRAKVTK